MELGWNRHMFRRRNRTKHTLTFEERLAQAATQLEEQARSMPPGQERDAIMKKARQAETAAHINDWLSSPGLRPAK